MSGEIFNQLTEVYEAMIDWPKRLAHEEPFYRSVFARAGVSSVVDVACGTGRHAAMFRSWGLRVEGSDLSPKMIETARANYGESDELRWRVRGFDEPIEPPAAFDAAICVGNSLALAPREEVVARAIKEMLAAVREGGLLVVHLLNLWRLSDGPCVWQKCKRAAIAQGDVLIVKGVHRCGTRGYVELIVADPAGGAPVYTESVRFMAIESDQLQRMAREAGAVQVDFFGDYREGRYDRAKSVDLLMVARK